MEQTVKGLFLKNLLELIKKEKGLPGLKELERIYGPLNFSALTNYSVKEDIKVRKAAAIVLFGEDSSENQFKIGKLSFKIYAESAIGKTIFSLLSLNPKKLALSVQRVLNTVTTGFLIKVEDLGLNKIKFTMYNNPYDIRYYEGVWAGALEFMGCKAYIESQVLKPNVYEYIVSWS